MDDSTNQLTKITVIKSSSGWINLKLNDLWEYRELLFFLAKRDISVRYKQTLLGATWAIIQPFFTMIRDHRVGFTEVFISPNKSFTASIDLIYYLIYIIWTNVNQNAGSVD